MAPAVFVGSTQPHLVLAFNSGTSQLTLASSYFASWFHIFDGIVIAAAFVIDVLLRGVLEEVASLVVILRLWRFFKIIEEFSVGAQEQMDGLEERIEGLERENEKLKTEMARSKGRDLDEEASVGIEGQT